MNKVKFLKRKSANHSDTIVYHLYIDDVKTGYFVYHNPDIKTDEIEEYYVWIKNGFVKDADKTSRHLLFIKLSEAKHECVRQYNVKNNISQR
jgi:hypothetical protein